MFIYLITASARIATIPNYSVGPDCYNEIPAVTARYGKKVVLIGGKTALSKAQDAILEAVKGHLDVTGVLWYGGNATYENVDKLMNTKEVQDADMVFAVGGGRAVDCCKTMADKMGKPVFTFPTIASNCAACTAICVMYKLDGSLAGYYYPQHCAEHTFINTKIIAEAPEKLLWAGIGDALSKECEVLIATEGKKLLNTPLLGIVSNLTTTENDYYYNSSLGHCFYNAYTGLACAERHMHGEVVSFGVIVLLTCDKQFELRDKMAKFNKELGLPVTLAEIEVDEAGLEKILDRAPAILEWKKVPYEMTREKFKQAILDADAYGKTL